MTFSFKLPVITFGDALSQAWLAARGLDACVQKEERMDLPSLSCSNRWLFYRLSPHAGVVSHAPDANIRTAIHGTSWYALWGLLRSGRVLESNDETKGHKFWHPGAGRERARERERESQLCEKSQFFGRLPSGPLLMNWPPGVGPLTATPSHTPPRGRKRDT